MGNHTRRKHSVGMNDFHEKRIINAYESGDGCALDTAIHSVVGTRRAVRRRAEAVFELFIKKGGEMPIPMIEPTPQPVLDYGILKIGSVQLIPIE